MAGAVGGVGAAAPGVLGDGVTRPDAARRLSPPASNLGRGGGGAPCGRRGGVVRGRPAAAPDSAGDRRADQARTGGARAAEANRSRKPARGGGSRSDQSREAADGG